MMRSEPIPLEFLGAAEPGLLPNDKLVMGKMKGAGPAASQ